MGMTMRPLPQEGRGSSPVLLNWRGLQFTVGMAFGEILRPSNCHMSYLLKYNKILFFSLKININ
jgi:hypothetical protein